MATYNGEKFIHEQLDSILNQTILPDELVICDDCSTDCTLEIIHSFKDRCTFPINIFSNTKTLWVIKNFEQGMRYSKGDIIILADQDDVWHPNKIEIMTQAFRDNPNCGYVFSDARLVSENGKSLEMNLWKSIGFNKDLIDKFLNGKQLEIMLRYSSFIYGMSMGFRAKFLPDLLPIESYSFNCTHDTWISLMLTAKGAYGVLIQNPLVEYRQHETQLAGGGMNRVEFLTKLKMIFKANNCEQFPSLADALDHIVIRLNPNNETCTPSDRNMIRNKAVHLRARYLIGYSHGFRKLQLIYAETISGRYSFYSRAILSIIKDLISSKNL